MLSDLENEGGAAVSASRLATSLRRAGESVTRIVARRGAAPDESTLAIRSALRVPTRLAIPSVVALARRIRHRSAERRLASILRDQRPDVVSIHNLHNASTFGWSFRFVELAAAVAPVFVTLHDMWSFTGRCAYNGACRRFESECDAGCPTPGEYPAWPSRGIASEHRLRRAVLDAHPTITAIAPSRWIAAEARRGLWRTHSVEVVPYGVDLSIFRPMPRSVARQRLGIPQDVPVVLFAVHHFADKRKGSPFLVEVMRRMSRPAAFLAMGSGARRLSGVILLGWIGPDEQKALVYNAADLMVHAATEDNLPNTVIEAIACGTPVAAFNAGGIGEIVRPGVSGWLSPEMSGAALAETVDAAVRSIAAGDDLRASARKHAEENYDSGREAQRYLELFSGRTHSAS
jgi:glycosyltransferase involved in cell wall biosynthesis